MGNRRFTIWLKYLLLACILLGAVGVPWGSIKYQAWRRKSEAQSLKQELAIAELEYFRVVLKRRLSPGITREIPVRDYSLETPPVTPNYTTEELKWLNRITSLKDRIEKLTGVRPSPLGE